MTAGRALRAPMPGLTVASFRGIALRIDRSWVIIFVLVAWSAAAYFPRALPGLVEPAAAIVWGLLASCVLFLSILAHELSHSLVARALGYEVRAITLFVFGGVSEISGEPKNARDEGAIALAGPALSFAIAGVLHVFGALLPEANVLRALVSYLAAANFAIAVFNLLPGFPLDGGRALRALFRALGDSLVKATRKAAFAGRLLGLALIGWFLKSSADAGYRQVAMRAQLEDLHVGEVAERLVPLAPDASVLSALRDHGLYAGSNARYPVAEGGRLLGMVAAERLRAIPRDRWAEVRVGELLDEGPSAAVTPDATVLEALDVMGRNERQEIAVADERGDYWGVLRLDRILTTPETTA
jgi:Zn-dependent protease/CBS domain-containing protein